MSKTVGRLVVGSTTPEQSHIKISSTTVDVKRWMLFHDFDENVVAAYQKYNGMSMFGLVEGTLEALQDDLIWNTDHGKREAQRLYSLLKIVKSTEDKLLVVPTTSTSKPTSSATNFSHFLSMKQVVAAESNEQDRLSDKYSILGNPQGSGDTWIEALSRETEALELNTAVTYGPPEIQYFVLQGVFFKDSEYKILRFLRAFLSLTQCFTGYVIGVQLYLILDADIFTCVAWCMSWNFYVGCWSIVYRTNSVRKNSAGNAGIALRVFRLMDEVDTIGVVNSRFNSGCFTATLLTYCLNMTLWVYLFIRWYDQNLWGQVFTVISVMNLFLFPSLNPVGVGLLYYQSMEAASRLIRKYKCFVYKENTGCLDWCAVQKNFDVLEQFVEDLSDGWKYFVFGTNFVASLSLMSMLVGLTYDAMAWAQTGYQPETTVVLILFEVLFVICYTYFTVWGWLVAAEVTSACQDVTRQSQQVLAYLRMHRLFEYNTEEYIKAEMFAKYVEKVDLGLKMHGICISYSLGMRILYPLVSAIALILPIVFKN